MLLLTASAAGFRPSCRRVASSRSCELAALDLQLCAGGDSIAGMLRWYTGTQARQSHKVADAHEGERLTKRAADAFPALGSKSQAELAAKAGLLLLNGEAVETTRRVRAGDVLRLEPRAVAPPSHGRLRSRARFVAHLRTAGLRTAFEDDSMAVVVKPPGVHTKTGSNPKFLALEDALPALLLPPPPRGASGAADALPLPLAVHRLDVPVSGLCVVAKTRAAHRALSAAFEERMVRKTYEALLVGDVRRAAAELGHEGEVLELTEQIEGQRAETELHVLGVVEKHPQWGALTRVRLHPKTGRMHQLRVHRDHIVSRRLLLMTAGTFLRCTVPRWAARSSATRSTGATRRMYGAATTALLRSRPSRRVRVSSWPASA